jgi:hypothetical protein
VVLMFECGDASPAHRDGCGARRGHGLAAGRQAGHGGSGRRRPAHDRVAPEQLVLRCGKASITLTKAGKVLIEGSYVSSKSTGVNRIKGGSVQLN